MQKSYLKFKKKTKFFSFLFFLSLFFVAGCKNYVYNYPAESYNDFIKVVKDHFGWIKDDNLWGDEYDDSKWNNYTVSGVLSSDFQSYFDGNNYKTNLNNDNNWSAIYWFPKITVSGNHGSADYQLNINNNAVLISVGRYFNQDYKSIKDKLPNCGNLQLPSATDPEGHFTMLFSLNGTSIDLNDIYEVTYDFTISDTAGSFIDSSLNISNIQSFKIINSMQDPNGPMKNIIEAYNKDKSHFNNELINHFQDNDFNNFDISKLKVIGYSLLDKDSAKDKTTYDQDWNLINSSAGSLIRDFNEYTTKHSHSDKDPNYWFNDGSLKKIYFSYPDPSIPGFSFKFAFNILWNADPTTKTINRSDQTKEITFSFLNITWSSYEKNQ